jgi:hypothetical protein
MSRFSYLYVLWCRAGTRFLTRDSVYSPPEPCPQPQLADFIDQYDPMYQGNTLDF